MANTSGPQAPIGNGQTLNSDAARYYLALVALIALETGIAIVATEGTRTYARQKYLYDGYRAGKAGFNPAWHPDNAQAYHLSGRAVDVGSGVGYLATLASKAFYARASRFGFRPSVPGEPWHFEWRREWVQPGILDVVQDVADAAAAPTFQEETPMFLARRNSTGTIGLFGVPGKGAHFFTSPDQYRIGRNILTDSGVKLAGNIDMPAWEQTPTIRSYDEVGWINLVEFHTPAPVTVSTDTAALGASVVESLRAAGVFSPDVDEAALAATLAPILSASIAAGTADELSKRLAA